MEEVERRSGYAGGARVHQEGRRATVLDAMPLPPSAWRTTVSTRRPVPAPFVPLHGAWHGSPTMTYACLLADAVRAGGGGKRPDGIRLQREKRPLRQALPHRQVRRTT